MVRSAHPNTIVFFTDQQRWDTSGLHGCPLDLTPNFDRMAMAGTHVAHSFTCQPVCGPARSILQTGMYPTTTGCYRNGIALPEEAKTLAHYFHEGGYDTAYIGKWHLAHDDPVPKAQRGGYDYWLASNVLEFTSDAYSTMMYNGDNQPVRLPGYRIDAITDAAIRYIDHAKKTGNPFYLFLSFLDPHHQNHRDDYPAPEGYAERYRGRWIPSDLAALGGSTHQHIAGYYGMVKRLDEALGRLIDALRSLNLLDDTILLYTSDHANHFKTRNDEYKRSCHESSIRVPTALRGPGFNGGGQLSQLVSLIDLPPTLLQAANLSVPSHMQGKSFFDVVARRSDVWTDDVYIQISETQVGRAIRTGRWKYSVCAPDKDGLVSATSDTYVEEFLYDLYADPYELNNLVGCESHRELSDVLRDRLVRRMLEAGEPAPQILPAASRPAGQRKVFTDELNA